MAHAGGRPPKYDPEIHPRMARLCYLAGMTDDQTAVELEIDRSTLYQWRKDYSKFSDATLAKEPPEVGVVRSLAKRAMGYKYKETKVREVKEVSKEGVETTVQRVKETTFKEMPPDTAAIVWFTKNKMPDQYRDRREFYTPPTQSPLRVELPEALKGPDLLDPEKQDNLDISPE